MVFAATKRSSSTTIFARREWFEGSGIPRPPVPGFDWCQDCMSTMRTFEAAVGRRQAPAVMAEYLRSLNVDLRSNEAHRNRTLRRRQRERHDAEAEEL